MAKFEITGPDGKKYEVEGESAEGALNALKKHLSGEYAQPAPPEGMMLDPKTGAMVDVNARAEQQSQGLMGTMADMGAKAISGIPFAGSYMDEAMGAAAEAQGVDGDIVTATARKRMDNFEEKFPKISGGLKVAGGVAAALPMAATALPAMSAAAPASLPMKMAATAAVGAPAGAVEGAVYGYGEGETDAERIRNAKKQAVVGGVMGAGVGLAAPAVGAGVKKVASAVMNSKAARNLKKEIGLPKDLTDAIMPALKGDGAFDGAGAENIRRAGPDAMLADAGPSTRRLLDTSIQTAGPAASQARQAVEDRATRATQRFNEAADSALGPRIGLREAQGDISRTSAVAREMAFQGAFATPIDYAAGAGRQVEDVLSRVPNNLLKSSIEEANEAMQMRGARNMQIMADIADDGSITFREMPNVEQLHSLKVAMQEIADQQTDGYGKITGKGLRYGKLAGELRGAIIQATDTGNGSLYAEAMRLGGDKIGEEQALRMGSKLLNRGTTMEEVAEQAANFTPEQRAAAATGVRNQVGERMANVQRTLSDPNVEARQGADGIKVLSSEANRNKLTSVLGPEKSGQFFDEVDRAGTAFDLRAGVADNSATFARQNAQRVVDARVGAPIRETIAEPLSAYKRAAKAMLGISDDQQLKLKEETWVKIADALTQAQGGDTRRALMRLSEAATQSPESEKVARALADKIVAQGASNLYVAGTRLEKPKQWLQLQ